MLLLTSTTDVIRLVTSQAGAIDVHASFVDHSAGTFTPGRLNETSIVSAGTTTVVDAPAASTQRNIKHLSISNDHASVTNIVTVEHFDNTTAETLWKGTLLPGQSVTCDATGKWTVYDVNGTVKIAGPDTLFGFSIAAQGPGFASDTYLTGSYIKFDAGGPKVGTKYKCRFSVAKTGAGTATPIVQVRTGTAGTTGDTSRNSFTFNAGTANADVAWFEIYIMFRSVGSGTAAVGQGMCLITKGVSATTGFINLPAQVVQTTSGGFDSTTANLGIGVSVNGGTSAAWTVQLVSAEIENN